MRFRITFYDSGKVNVTLEASKLETPGCVYEVDNTAYTKGKVTVYTKGENGSAFPEDGFNFDSPVGTGRLGAIAFIQQQYERCGLYAFPRSLEPFIEFMYRPNINDRNQCTGSHADGNNNEQGDNGSQSFEETIDSFTNKVIEAGKRNESYSVIRGIMASLVVASVTSGSQVGASSYDNIAHYGNGDFGLDKEFFHHGFNGNEQDLSCGMSYGWDTCNPVVLVKHPAICDTESSEEKSFDDGQGGLHFWGLRLWMDKGRVMHDRKVPMGVHLHSSMEQLPQVGDSSFADHTGVRLRDKSTGENLHEMGWEQYKVDIKQIADSFGFLAIILAVVTENQMKWLLLVCLINSSSTEALYTGEKIMNYTNMNRNMTSTVLSSVESTIGPSNITTGPVNITTPHNSRDAGSSLAWNLVKKEVLANEVMVEKYLRYTLWGRRVALVWEHYDEVNYVWEDSWRGPLILPNSSYPSDPNVCDQYQCDIAMYDEEKYCDMPVPENVMHLNNKTYQIGSKPFESGFVSTAVLHGTEKLKGARYGLKSIISCSHNQDVYGTIDTDICVFANVNISGVIWEFCTYSCDICAHEEKGDVDYSNYKLAVHNTPTWLPNAVKVYNCSTDSRIASNQRVCWSIMIDREIEYVIDRDTTRYVVDQDYGAVCQWNDSPDVSIRTCWCRQMMEIYVTDCRNLGNTIEKRSWKNGKVGSIYTYEDGHEWLVVHGKYISVSPRSEEVRYKMVDAIGFGYRSPCYATKYGIFCGVDFHPISKITSKKIQISLIRSLGDTLIQTLKVSNYTTMSKFMPTSTYDSNKEKIMSLLTTNRRNYTVYDGSSMWWYGSMKGCGGYGPETFCTNNVLQECKMFDSRTIRNACMMMGSTPQRNDWLLAVYILIGYLCTGGMSQIFHFGRFIMYLAGYKRPYYKKMMWLQGYCLSWCYGSDLDEKHQEFALGMRAYRFTSYLKERGGLVSTSNKGDWEWQEDRLENMTEDEMRNALINIDSHGYYNVSSSIFRKKMRYILFIFPQWLYLSILLQYTWCLLTIWNVGLYLWYATKQERNLHRGNDKFDRIKTDEEKQSLLDSSRTKELNKDADLNNVVINAKKTSRRFNPNRKYILRFLGIFFWIMIGKVECVTRTYVINCDDGECERAIDIDELVMLTNGSTLDIDLRNPDTGEVDGRLSFTMTSLQMRVVGAYEFSTVQSELMHYESYSDASDCETDCSNPFLAVDDTDFGEILDPEYMKTMISHGPYSWATKVETTGLNHGYCIGLTAIRPLWGLDIARSFKLTDTESIATVFMEMITDTEQVTETFTTTLNGKTFNFGDDNKIQFIEEENHFGDLSNERIICYFEAGKMGTVLRDCSAGAIGINEGYAMKTVGEGALGYSAWRNPIVNNMISNEHSMCDDCISSHSCTCNCRHKWSTSLLENFNRQDIKDMGSKEPPNDCITTIEVTQFEETDGTGRCIDWTKTDEEECDIICPGSMKPCWVSKKIRKPRSIDIRSSGCAGSKYNIKASVRSKYDGSTVSSIISSSDIDITGLGCWGTIYSYQLSYKTEKQGILYLVSDTLQVPSLVNVASDAGTFNGTATLDLQQYYFYILDEDGKKTLITVSGGLEACDGIVDGGNGEQGGADIETGYSEDSWWLWLVVIACSVAALMLILLIINMCRGRDKSNIEIMEKNKYD